MKTRNIPTSWLISEREDLSQAQKMIDAGFEVEYDANDYRHNRIELPQNNISFVMGKKHVWKVKGWITADLIDGYFKNHTHFNSLDEIIGENLINLEFSFYDSIKLPFYNHCDMSGGSWLTNYDDEVEDRSNQMFIYVNATWLFYDDEDNQPNGIEVRFHNEDDVASDKMPRNEFYPFAQPTNLIELANYRQFYYNLLLKLSAKYLVDSKKDVSLQSNH